MTIQQANQYFAALPDGFAAPEQLGALLPASVQQCAQLFRVGKAVRQSCKILICLLDGHSCLLFM